MDNFTNWHKSSFSGGAGENCIEQGSALSAAGEVTEVGVRDTKLGHASPVLTVSPAAWQRFTKSVI